jgi:CheY-like chemotaxis protein
MGGHLAATSGQETATTEAIPLTYRGEPLGELIVGHRSPHERLSLTDRRLLADLADHCGVALYAAEESARTRRLAVDLQRAREQLVTAREEDLRRIRRDLHDSLGPALSGQALTIDTARTLLASDPCAADRLLADLHDHSQQTLTEVRRLARQLRPPALDELGLAAALRHIPDQYRPQRLSVTVTSADLPPLPAAVEVATYRIVHEALTNVSRHAHASAAWLKLTWTGDALEVEVRDDGRGIATNRPTGIGTTSMRERRRTGRDIEHRSRPTGGHAGGGPNTRPAQRPGPGATTTMTPIRILLADDHPMFRYGLWAVLDSSPDTTLVGEAATGDEAVAQAAELRPDVVLMDLTMPGLSGIEATRRILTAHPDTKVLVLTMFDDSASVMAAIRAGARGSLVKGADRDEILRAVHAAAAGEAIFSPTAAQHLTNHLITPPPT